MFRSIQGKLVVVYLLLIVVAMELASLYLLRELERSYIGKVQDDLHQSAQLLAGQLSNFIRGDRLDPEAVDQYMERWPGEVLVLDANGVVIGATARLPNREELLGLKFSHDDVSPAFFGNINRRTGMEGSQRMAYEAVPITVADNVIGVIYLKDSLEEAYARLQDIRGHPAGRDAGGHGVDGGAGRRSGPHDHGAHPGAHPQRRADRRRPLRPGHSGAL